MGEGLKRARKAALATQRSPLEQRIRNIIYNVEQDPSRVTVTDLLHSMRNALGLRPGEKP